jgi:hypothetical protein
METGLLVCLGSIEENTETDLLDRKCQLSFIEGSQFPILGNTLYDQ